MLDNIILYKNPKKNEDTILKIKYNIANCPILQHFQKKYLIVQ